jgi:hypothetical protein
MYTINLIDNAGIKQSFKETRSRIFNTILGAIGCLSLFSFLKDFWPCLQDSQYAGIYKFVSVLLPVCVMTWLIWYMSGKKSYEFSIDDYKRCLFISTKNEYLY